VSELKLDAVNEYFILNGSERKVEDSAGVQEVEGPLVYEVNRVKEGVVLFEEGHINRLKESIEMMGYEIQFSEDEISDMMKKLIAVNRVDNQNIKIVYGDLKKESHKILVYFVDSVYPERDVYEKGIKTILFESERENPNAKIVNQTLRDRINEQIGRENAFEALLVDGEGFITEGSRSNFFYILEGKLYTPPAEKVLLGMTRREVIASAEEKGIDLTERPLLADEIESLEGAFITGTSIDALPIGSIGDVKLETAKSELMKSIMDGYNSRVEDYIAKKKA
jgi:branched-chain amino acid aminotransferase